MGQFKGTAVALVTPFHADGSIDFDALKQLIEHGIAGGLDYLVVLGTTGESATLSTAEKHEIFDFVAQVNNGRLPLVAGFGGNNTQQVIDDIAAYHFKGYSAILSASPYYNKPTQAGIYAHYAAIAGKSPLPIILYNVPGRTSSNMTADTTLRLARDFDNIVAIKEASGDLEQCMAIVQGRPDGFDVISGEDMLTLPMMSFGMDGVISVVAQAFPAIYSALVNAAAAGDFGTAQKEHFKLTQLTPMLFAEGNPAGIKASLETLGIGQANLRLPLVSVSEDLQDAIQVETKRIAAL